MWVGIGGQNFVGEVAFRLNRSKGNPIQTNKKRKSPGLSKKEQKSFEKLKKAEKRPMSKKRDARPEKWGEMNYY